MYKIFFIIISFTVLLTSCKKMDDVYKEFIKNGETVYVGKADSIKIRPGKNRLELSWLLISDPKVTSYKVYWNNRRDSIEGSVLKTANVDTVKVMINNLPEDIYIFDIYLYDQYKNSSVKTTAIGRSHNQFYQSSLLNRPYRTATRSGADAVTTWFTAATDLVYTQLSYTDNSGKELSKKLPASANSITLEGIPVRGQFTHRSAFLPEPNALDTFYTQPATVVLTN